MGTFSIQKIHGDVITKIDECLSYLGAYAAYNDRNVEVNRLYIDNELVRINFSVDGKKYLLAVDNKVVLSHRNSKDISKKHEIKYEQLASRTDIIRELFNG